LRDDFGIAERDSMWVLTKALRERGLPDPAAGRGTGWAKAKSAAACRPRVCTLRLLGEAPCCVRVLWRLG